MADNILEVKNLKKYFKTSRGFLHAVDDISFTLERGKTLGIVGESGCGKSTAGRCILRLIEPTGGEILFNGENIAKKAKKEMSKLTRLYSEGKSYYHRYCPKHNSVTNLDASGVKFVAFKMCQEAGVDILLHLEVHDVTVKDKTIEGVAFFGKGNQVTVKAKQFIDCTGDGDLAFIAGCNYNMGRGNKHELMPPTVMCTVENVNVDKMLDYVEQHPESMQAMCSTIDTKSGYDAAYFKADPNFVFVGMTDIFSRLRKEGKCPVERGNMIAINGLHKGQMYLNTTRLLNVDATDILSLTKAEIEGHLQNEQLVQTLKENVPGFENCYISSVAPSLGVRETRRFEGIYCLGIEEALNGEISKDSICLSGYKIDVHKNNENETLFKTIKKPFGIPYGCLVSKDLNNLMFAGRCVSVDEDVIGSIRIMSSCMGMGQAAGVACSMALDKNIMPRDVDVQALRTQLVKDGAIVG